MCNMVWAHTSKNYELINLIQTSCNIDHFVAVVQQSLCVPQTHEAVSAHYVTDDNTYRYADS